VRESKRDESDVVETVKPSPVPSFSPPFLGGWSVGLDPCTR